MKSWMYSIDRTGTSGRIGSLYKGKESRRFRTTDTNGGKFCSKNSTNQNSMRYVIQKEYNMEKKTKDLEVSTETKQTKGLL